MVKIFYSIYYKLIDLICFRFLCYFTNIRDILLFLVNYIDKKYKIDFVFYNKWGIGDCLHDICYLQELHNRGIIRNPTIYIEKSFNSIRSLMHLFPDIKIKQFPPHSFLGISLWQNQYRDIDKIKYSHWVLKCKGLKKDFKYKNALLCAYKKLPKRINIKNSISHNDLIIGFAFGAKNIINKNKSILICNSIPLSGQASINDVKVLEEMALFFSSNNINVYLTKKLEFVNRNSYSKNYIHELSYTLADYLKEGRDYSLIIGIATGPIWLALRNNIESLIISRKDNFGKDFKKVRSFKNIHELNSSKEYQEIIKKII